MKKVNECDGIYSSSINVRFTKTCDNNCPFCIERDGIKNQKRTTPTLLAKNTIEVAKKYNKTSILILGGEPLLYPKDVLAYIKLIREQLETIYITTSLPEFKEEDKASVLEVLDLIDGINVSVHHYDYKINNQLLRASNDYNRLDNLRWLNQHASNKIRVNVNPTKGFIDNKDKFQNFLQVMSSLGCKHIKVQELQKSPDMYVNFEQMVGIKLKEPYKYGCQNDITNIDIPNINKYGMQLTLKRSCFVVEPSLNKTYKAYLKYLYKKIIKPYESNANILYENGSIAQRWLKEVDNK